MNAYSALTAAASAVFYAS